MDFSILAKNLELMIVVAKNSSLITLKLFQFSSIARLQNLFSIFL